MRTMLSAVMVLAMMDIAHADQINWTAGAPGSFDDPNNWTRAVGGHVVPGANDSVSFSTGNAATPALVDVPNSFNLNSLSVAGLDTGIGIHGANNTIGTSLTVQGSFSGAGDSPTFLSISGPGTVNVGGSTFVGTQGIADSTLVVGGGAALNTASVSIGGAGSKGTVAVDGGTLTAGAIQVGSQGPGGTLEVSNGAVTVNGGGGMLVGNAGGTGTVAVNPSGSLTLTGGPLTIGSGLGSGTLVASGGNQVFPAKVFPATINAGGQDVRVGIQLGTGILSLQAQSSLVTTGVVSIGTNSGTGTVVMDGLGTFGLPVTTLTAGSVVVGASGGTGILSLNNFSSVKANAMDVGINGGTGIVTTTGASSGFTVAGDLRVGNSGGTGTVALTAVTGLSVGGSVTVGDGSSGSNGTFSADSATVMAHELVVGRGSGNTGIGVASGTAGLTVGDDVIIGSLGGQGTLALKDQATLQVNGASNATVTVGNFGTGTLSVADNSALTAQGRITVGGVAGNGVAVVAGKGLLSGPTVNVGDGGIGTLSLQGSGEAGGPNNLVASQALTIGVNQGTGAVQATNAAHANVNAINVAIDKGSTGTLSIASGSNVNATGALTIGSNLAGGGSATVAVDHASLSARSAAVGRGGDSAVLAVQNAGQFNTTGGVSVGSNGLFEVTGAGSKASVGGVMAVGGPVAVANANLAAVVSGGELDTHGISVGNGGTGALVVDGSTSKVINVGAVSIGGGGGSGTVSLTNNASLSSSGVITVDRGGTLIGTGDVNGTVVNAGGMVVPGGSPGKLSIGGDFTQQTGGTLMFDIFGTDPSEFDQLSIGGNARVAGKLLLDFAFAPTIGTTFDLIDVAGIGDFSGLTSIEAFGAINGDLISSFEDGQLVVSFVPEPQSWVLLLFGLAGLTLVRRSILERRTTTRSSFVRRTFG